MAAQVTQRFGANVQIVVSNHCDDLVLHREIFGGIEYGDGFFTNVRRGVN